MIPYTISRVFPSSSYNNTRNCSIGYYVCDNINDLIIDIIAEIVEFMYEFCSNEYGHSIEISSYFDFCNKWWNFQECIINDDYIFEIYYFQNNTWIEMNITDYNDEIYKAYVKYVYDKKNNL